LPLQAPPASLSRFAKKVVGGVSLADVQIGAQTSTRRRRRSRIRPLVDS
jgi:hypothetical protein